MLRNPPPRDNAFFMPTGPGNPLFPSISQQSTVGILSTHANRLTKYQSIHWYCLLVYKMWAWCRTHHPDNAFFRTRELETPISQQETLLLTKIDYLDANIS